MSDPHRATAERFPSTHWSLVGEAGASNALTRGASLARLLGTYLPALKTFLTRKRKLRPEEADDLLQSFVGEKVLDGRFLGAADQARGRFRSFLLTSLDHFLVDQIRRRKAEPPTSDLEDEAPAADAADPFDVAWARQVINEALRRTAEKCSADARPDLWGMFEQRVVGPTLLDRPAPPYEELVRTYDFVSPSQASNCLVTAKRMFARTLREVVIEYAGEGANVEAELRDLMTILSGGRAR